MIKKTRIFYVVDFDRCLGNIDGSFEIIKEVVHELGIVNRDIFKSMRKEIESDGLTFSALEQITAIRPDVNMDEVEKLYIKHASTKPENLLEPGATEFIDYLKETDSSFCIMSYGDKKWQDIKIKSCGLDRVHTVIVDSASKSEYIRKWFYSNRKEFIIPKKFFVNNKSREYDEVVLIDDKISAFKTLPKEARGYYVSGSSSRYQASHRDLSLLPSNVVQVYRIDEIITYESKRKNM